MSHVATTMSCDDLGKDSGASHGVEGIGSQKIGVEGIPHEIVV